MLNISNFKAHVLYIKVFTTHNWAEEGKKREAF